MQPYVPHQEINASPTEVLECLLRRSDGEAVALAVSLDIEAVEQPSTVLWIDPTPPRRRLVPRLALSAIAAIAAFAVISFISVVSNRPLYRLVHVKTR